MRTGLILAFVLKEFGTQDLIKNKMQVFGFFICQYNIKYKSLSQGLYRTENMWLFTEENSNIPQIPNWNTIINFLNF